MDCVLPLAVVLVVPILRLRRIWVRDLGRNVIVTVRLLGLRIVNLLRATWVHRLRL